TNNGNETWTLTLPGRPPIQTRVVALAGDNLITQAESVASILGSERVMTRLRAMLHYGGHTLTGSIEVRYPAPSGAVVRGRTRATLDCPGTDSPKAVVVAAGAHRATLPSRGPDRGAPRHRRCATRRTARVNAAGHARPGAAHDPGASPGRA